MSLLVSIDVPENSSENASFQVAPGGMATDGAAGVACGAVVVVGVVPGLGAVVVGVVVPGLGAVVVGVVAPDLGTVVVALAALRRGCRSAAESAVASEPSVEPAGAPLQALSIRATSTATPTSDAARDLRWAGVARVWFG